MKRFQTVVLPERSRSSTNKNSPFLVLQKNNHFCVTPNDCRRQLWVFKQVMESPCLTVSAKRPGWIPYSSSAALL